MQKHAYLMLQKGLQLEMTIADKHWRIWRKKSSKVVFTPICGNFKD